MFTGLLAEPVGFESGTVVKYDPNLLAVFWSESYTIDGQAAWNTAMDKICNRIQKQIKAMEGADHVTKPEFKLISVRYLRYACSGLTHTHRRDIHPGNMRSCLQALLP